MHLHGARRCCRAQLRVRIAERGQQKRYLAALGSPPGPWGPGRSLSAGLLRGLDVAKQLARWQASLWSGGAARPSVRLPLVRFCRSRRQCRPMLDSVTNRVIWSYRLENTTRDVWSPRGRVRWRARRSACRRNDPRPLAMKVIRGKAYADGRSDEWPEAWPLRWFYLRWYDPEACNGEGESEWTPIKAEAIRFENVVQAYRYWTQVARKRLRRPEGTPNKPLTDILVTFEDADEGDGRTPASPLPPASERYEGRERERRRERREAIAGWVWLLAWVLLLVLTLWITVSLYPHRPERETRRSATVHVSP
jgi:hypothetical protein